MTSSVDILTFLKSAEKLKCTLRSGYASDGRRESTAEHTWRLCLMVMVFEKQLPPEINLLKLLKICLIHDLGEAIGGDIPATEQKAPKSDSERRDFMTLLAPLEEAQRAEFLALWDEYENASSPEAVFAKGFDKLETILQHSQGENPPGFDYDFNLSYGKKQTDAHPLLSEIRQLLDAETRARKGENK